jgi:hypothetical protein
MEAEYDVGAFVSTDDGGARPVDICIPTKVSWLAMAPPRATTTMRARHDGHLFCAPQLVWATALIRSSVQSSQQSM